jgi:putative FmdB family regulatory protein
MPIYEYKCEACGHALEAIQKMSDAPLADCPACGAAQLKRLISAAGFQLKGTGWYATDFKGNGKKPAAKDKTDSGETKAEPTKHGCGKGTCGCA